MKHDTLLDYVNRGFSIRQISSETGWSFTTVKYWLKKYGLRTKSRAVTYRCLSCGDCEETRFYADIKHICKRCWNIKTLERQQETRKKALEYLGGKCLICGFDDFICSLDIHHLDPLTKDKDFSRMRGWSWKRVERELENCVVLCSNCHNALHAGMVCLMPPRGPTDKAATF